MSGKIYLRQLEVGPMQNYCYLVGDPETREVIGYEMEQVPQLRAAAG